ncbi:MAG: pyridoxamine 5'-phosphate oxidase family protein [Chitinophagaceae bacterium]
MIGELNNQQIDALLSEQVVGRLACSYKKLIYIVPVSYAHEGNYIYVRTFEGSKLDIMRKNPEVCFEADNINNMADWQSVIAWGTFEELKDKQEREKGLRILLKRHLPMNSSITTHLGRTWPFSEYELEEITGIVFRIAITKKTGRFEHNSQPDPILD